MRSQEQRFDASRRRLIYGLALTPAFALSYKYRLPLFGATEYDEPLAGTHARSEFGLFWIGRNVGINYSTSKQRTVTAWDHHPEKRFGGVDDPLMRTPEGLPAKFKPKHNPFYFVLSSEVTVATVYPRLRQTGTMFGHNVVNYESDYKGRWARISNESTGKSVYCQWLDIIGAAAMNSQIGLSPAALSHLKIASSPAKSVRWEIVSPHEVDNGPWQAYRPIALHNHWYEPNEFGSD